MPRKKQPPPAAVSLPVTRVVEQAPIYLCLFCRERKFLWANRYALGYRAADLVGTLTEVDLHPEDRPVWVHQMRLCLDLGETHMGTCRTLAAAQRLAYRMAPVRDGRGRIVAALVASWDVTLLPTPDAARDPRRFLLTDLGRAILAFLRARGPAKGAAIGKAVGQSARNGQASSKLRWKLADLEERGILRRTGEGYAVTPEFAALGLE
jgi:hypothetical protein